LWTQAFQDQNRFLNGRGFDLDGLKTAFERGVLFNVFAILVQRGRADALHLAAAQGGLDDVEASIVPSAEPAPTMVCNSSMNRMMFLRGEFRP
jgi:hypothetical protein